MQDENKLSGERSAAAPAMEIVFITSLREMVVVICSAVYNMKPVSKESFFMNNQKCCRHKK
jgi:hypothetical protein